MPTHALLGATGSTGAAVLKCLLKSPEPLRINILIRSEEKLLKLFPDIRSEKKHEIQIFIGTASDQAILAKCLRDADIVYTCIGSNEIKVGNDLDESTARSVVQAIRSHKTESSRPPLVLVNRTIGLNDAIPNPGPGPGLIQNFMLWALDWVLDDMRAACRVYEQASGDGLLGFVFVDGPKLFPGEPTGFELVRTGKTSTGLNYGDLGAAFVEVGKRGDEMRDGAAGVSATGKVNIDVLPLIGSFLDLIMRGVRGKVLGW